MLRSTVLRLGLVGLCGLVLMGKPAAQPPRQGTLGLVDASGRQRMHSQRLLKAYALWSLDVMPERARVMLSEALSGLNQGNAVLRAANGDDGVQELLAAQTRLIDQLAGVTSITPSLSALQRTADLSEALLANAESLTAHYSRRPPQTQAEVVNLAARQRMLSQRAAAAFLLYQTPLRSPEVKQRAHKALADFKRTLAALDDARGEFAQIGDRIDAAKVQMVFFENALTPIDEPAAEQLVSVVVLSERILSEMDALTADVTRSLGNRGAGKPR